MRGAARSRARRGRRGLRSARRCDRGCAACPAAASPQLLARRFGARNPGDLPPLTERQILRWADAHSEAHGRWPVAGSGAVSSAPGETWGAVNSALRQGGRGLPGGSSLAWLLAAKRQVPNRMRLPGLTEGRILGWADAHRRRTGQWPGANSGPVADAPGETWYRVNLALWLGLRGLPGGDWLVRLRRRSGRQVPERRGRPPKHPASLR